MCVVPETRTHPSPPGPPGRRRNWFHAEWTGPQRSCKRRYELAERLTGPSRWSNWGGPEPGLILENVKGKLKTIRMQGLKWIWSIVPLTCDLKGHSFAHNFYCSAKHRQKNVFFSFAQVWQPHQIKWADAARAAFLQLQVLRHLGICRLVILPDWLSYLFQWNYVERVTGRLENGL